MNASDKHSAAAFASVEAMLRHARPKADNDAIMSALRSRFVSASAMYSASAHVLEECGLHRHDALLLSRIPELVRISRRSEFAKRPFLGRLPYASEYLIANSYGLKVERFYMLCLDARGKMKECVFLQEGTASGAMFGLKEMLAEVMRVSPVAVVLSHNHPGCTLRPSQEDIDCTITAIRALTAVGIPLLDHVIIAGSDAVSLRENGFIPASLWLNQLPGHALLENWLRSDEPSGASRRKGKK